MLKNRITPIEAVRGLHEYLRIIRDIFGDIPMEPFSEINQEQWQTGVYFLRKATHPGLSAKDYHEIWAAWKFYRNHQLGPGRDRERKIRSSLVPYEALTAYQKAKIDMIMDYAKRIDPFIEWGKTGTEKDIEGISNNFSNSHKG